MKIIPVNKEIVTLMLKESKTAKESGLETGGFLFGKLDRAKRTVLYATGPGPEAVRTPTFFEPDYGFSALEFTRLKKDNNFLKFVGIWHLHSVEGLSGGDIETLKRLDKSYPGFLSLVVSNNSMKIRAFCIEEGEVVERKLTLVKEKKSCLNFDRTQKLIKPSSLNKKAILSMGAGSGSSVATPYLARAGIREIALADPEKLEPTNLVRHLGTVGEIFEYKVDIIGKELKEIDPDIQLTLIREKLKEETAVKFKELFAKSDLILGSSGNISANRLTNEICLELKKPVVYAGVYQKAMGGFSFLSTGKENDPCFNCIFDYTSHGIDETNIEQEKAAKRYGFSVEELAEEQGLFIDISYVALLQAKMALLALLEGEEHQLAPLPGNFVSWNSRNMKTTWATIQKRKDCPVCNVEAYFASLESEVTK
ncbi:MAG: hypothetical protein F3745_09235 [Nitrospinae bacterium]|nr:hypothetical protein [Nitrospinota bacterium]